MSAGKTDSQQALRRRSASIALILAALILSAVAVAAFLIAPVRSDLEVVRVPEVTLPEEGGGAAFEAPARSIETIGFREIDSLPPEGESLLVQVLDQDGRPVPRTTVYLLPVADGGWPGWGVLEQKGTTHRTDETGSARVPREKSGSAWVAARQGDLAARARFEQSYCPAPLVLRLARNPRVCIPVRVVDQSGAGIAQVPVAIGTRVASVLHEKVRRRTDEDGLAVFDFDESDIHVVEGPLSLDVVAKAPLADPPRAPVDVTDPGREIRLTLSGVASLRLLVLSPSGEPVPRARVTVRPQCVNHRRDANRFGATEFADDSGMVSFPVVQPDDPLTVFLDGRGFLKNTSVTVDAIPSGAVHQGEVRFTDANPAIHVRILNPDRSPLASARIRLQRKSGISWLHASPGTTDDHGRFSFVVTPTRRATSFRVMTDGSAVAGQATVDIPASVPPAGLDLGDLVLQDSELLVSGTTIDPQGNLLPGMHVQARVLHDHTSYTAITDQQGCFTIHAPPSPTQSMVSIYSDHFDWFLEPYKSVPRGTAQLQLVLVPAARIELDIQLPDRSLPSDFHFALGGPPSDGGDHVFVLARWRGVREAVLTTTAEGSRDLMVLSRIGDAVIARIPNLRLERGATTTATLDLREDLHAFAFSVLGSDGQRLRAEVSLVGRSSGATFSGHRDWVYRGFHREREISVMVQHREYAPQVFAITPETRSLTLERAWTVTLRLEPRIQPPRDRIRILPILEPVDGGSVRPSVDPPAPNTTGDLVYGGATLQVRRPGFYRVHFELVLLKPERRSMFLKIPAPQEIEVRDVSHDQPFTCALPPEVLDAALERLREGG
jgi:hypothetical protein